MVRIRFAAPGGIWITNRLIYQLSNSALIECNIAAKNLSNIGRNGFLGRMH
jgi:hypothetical protein